MPILSICFLRMHSALTKLWTSAPIIPDSGNLMYPLPPNEPTRLRILDETGMLFSEPSDKFDRLCELAAELFEVPMAAVSLIGRDVQWFKAKIGLTNRITSRDAAFCNYTILHDEVLVVSDATRDHRFATNPMVTGDPGIRFYAGAPIVFSPAVRLGSLCVLDTRPRAFSALQKKCLKHMGESLGAEMRLIYAFRMFHRAIRMDAA
jgi:GAF domain-containing protein